MTKPVILTGLRANNVLTLGNYFGAMLPMIDMATKRAGEFQINMFIPDLHSFTTPIDHDQLYEQVIHNARMFAAAGLPLDNDDIHLYRQSFIPAHSEMTWILDCFTGVGEMNRMTQFKDKSQTLSGDQISVGLYNYPVLMAADILLYGAQYVPVGDDQTQHLEFTRDIAERMNRKFDDIFTVPEPVQRQHEFFARDQGLRIMDLVNPTKKMSKSDDSSKGVIFLSDDPGEAEQKVMRATTDDKALINYDRIDQPGITNLLDILALIRSSDLVSVCAEWDGQQRYGEFKAVVAGEVRTFLEEYQANLSRVDDDAVIAKLESSEVLMGEQATQMLRRVQVAVGLRAS